VIVLKVLMEPQTINSISGGVGPYSILWSTGSTENTINELAAGTYTATILDHIGCSIPVSVE